MRLNNPESTGCSTYEDTATILYLCTSTGWLYMQINPSRNSKTNVLTLGFL